jgi:hypothetical protein
MEDAKGDMDTMPTIPTMPIMPIMEDKAIGSVNGRMAGDAADRGRAFAVLVASCDRYSDLWGPFFSLFRRHWPDCPFKVYLLSNVKDAAIPGVNVLRAGEDLSWSDTIKAGLREVEEEYVLLHLDDLFLCGRVDTERLLRLFRWAADAGANCVKLNCRADSLPVAQLPDVPCNAMVGALSPGFLHKVSTVVSLWRVETLLALLKSGENAWEFETMGGERAEALDGFYSTWTNCFNVVNAVIRGKWRRSALRRIESLGVSLDLDAREMMSRGETFALYLKERRSMLLNVFPSRYKKRVKRMALRMASVSRMRKNPN